MANPRVAIIGAGPAGFYAAERLLKDPTNQVEIELFDRLPTPWGLVRAGVAPDHHALVFKAWVDDRAVHGCEFLHLDGDGLIDKLVVMLRPLSAARAVAEAMRAQFEIVEHELGSAA
jgi:NADPH-dependent 2,4-dienoyl-CoA reductase/sulfur reductase-like enzyme